MSEIVKTAVTTPFQLTELATGAKQLIAYGFAAEEVNGTLLKLGNVASGLGLPLERLTYLYGTTRTQGRLMARDMMQFTTSGIPLLDQLATMYGKTTQEINKMVSAGKIGFPEVAKAFDQMTGKGGRFHDLMPEMAKTIPGQISNLKDKITMAMNEIGQSNSGLIYGGIKMANSMVDNYEQVGKAIMGLVAIYGIYKTALIAAAAMNGTLMTSNLMLVRAFTAVRNSVVALNAAMATSPWIALGVIVASLVVSMWALHDSTTAQEKAQKKLNETLAESRQKKQDAANDVDKLSSAIRNGTSDIYEQVTAFNELIKKYEFFKKYSIDDIRNMTSEQWAKVMSEFNISADRGSVQGLVDKKKAEIAKLEKDLLRFENSTGVSPNDIARTRESLNIAKTELRGLEKEAQKVAKNIRQAEIAAMTPEEQKAYYEGRKKAIELQKKLVIDNANFTPQEKAKLLEGLNVALKEANEKAAGGKGVIKNKDFWDKQKKDAQELIDQMPVTMKGSAEWKAQQKLIDEADKNLLTYNSKKLDKIAEQEVKAENALEKATEEQLKKRAELDEKISQGTIDNMKDGFAKELAQLDVNHQKRLNEIEKEKRELLDKQNDKALAEWKKSGKSEASFVKSTTLNPEDSSRMDALTKQANENYLKSQTDLFKGFLENKRAEIEREYNETVVPLIKMMNGKNTDIVGLAIADAGRERKRKLKQLDKDILSEYGLESLMNGSGADWLTEKIKEVVPFFHSISESTVSELKKIQDVIDGIEIPQSVIDELKKKGVDVDALLKKLKEVKAAGSDSADQATAKKTADQYADAARALGQALSQSSDQFVKAVGEVVSELSGVIKTFGDKNSTGIEKASSIASLAIMAGNYLKEIRLWNWNKALNAQKELTKEAASRVKIETEINQLYAERLADSEESTFLGVDYAKKLSNAMSEIAKNGDSFNAAIDQLFSNSIFSAEGSAERNLFGTKTDTYSFTLNEVLNGMTAQGKSFMDVLGHLLDPISLFGGGTADKKARLDAYNGLTEGINKALSSMGKTVQDFSAMSSQEMLDFFNLMKEAGYITDQATLSLLEDAQEQLELIEEYQDKIKEVISTLSGSLGSSLKDILVNAFRGGFGYGVNEAKKTASAIASILEEQISSKIMQAAFGSLFNQLEDDMAASFGIGGDQSWSDDMQKFFQGIPGGMEAFTAMMKAAQEQAKAAGFDIFGSTRSSTASGIASASQDSVDELNGRATAIQGHTYSINENMKVLAANSEKALKHLAGIETNTTPISEMQKDIKSMKTIIGEIKDQGLRLK
ncbi:MAG: tape measure protein, partial [Bacteroidales bacterium]|nr:tape measure protein [Bacteroidales bacterium]